jgi:hypothetical protein
MIRIVNRDYVLKLHQPDYLCNVVFVFAVRTGLVNVTSIYTSFGFKLLINIIFAT